jgi:hypothetical protein
MLRRRGGLVRTVGRTAVVAGTASAVAGRVNRRQEERYAQSAEPAPPPEPAPAYAEPAPAPENDVTAQLQQLAELHSSGVLSDDEFASAKAKLLG